MKKLKTLLTGLTTALLLSNVVFAAKFPDKPIRIIVPYPAGGTADAVGRPLAVEMSKRLGVPVLLDYKSGAGGTIGAQYVSKSPPDGYTLLLAITGHSINPSLYKLSYDTLKDFAPVGFISKQGSAVLYLNANFPANTMREFIAYASVNPGKVSLASAGNGNSSHLAVELLAQRANLEILHVPYKGGAPSVTAAIGGEVSGVFAGIDTMNQVQAGRLKAVAVTTTTRSALLPLVPTISESGVPDYNVEAWYAILAPAGTASETVKLLNSTLNAALSDPAYEAIVKPLGYSTDPSTPEELDAHIRSEVSKWSKLVKSANIKIDQ